MLFEFIDYMEDKLELILTESFELFKRYGVRSVSMDDIARELSISKKTLYQYVENKTDLLSKIFEGHQVRAHKKYEEMCQKGENAIDVLLLISSKVLVDFSQARPSMRFDLQKYYPELLKEYTDMLHQFICQKMKLNLEQGISEGLYRTDLDVELVSLLYVKKLSDIQSSDFIESGAFSLRNVFEVMFENHIRGISLEEGVNYFEKKIKTMGIEELLNRLGEENLNVE